MKEYLFFALLAALCWGVAPIFEKIGLAKVNIFVAMFLRAGITLIFLSIVLIFQRNWQSFDDINISTLFYIFLGTVFSVLLAQYFYFRALNTGEASKVVAIVGIYPMLTMFIANFFLGEPLTISKILGIFFVFLGLQLII